MLKGRLHRLVGISTCQNIRLLEISCRGSFVEEDYQPQQSFMFYNVISVTLWRSSKSGDYSVLIFCLFDLILYVPSTIFQLNRDGSSRVEPVLSWDKCVLLKDHNTVTPVRLELAPPRSRVKRSTTEPLRSLIVSSFFVCLFDLILYVHSTIFQLCGTGLPGLNQY